MEEHDAAGRLPALAAGGGGQIQLLHGWSMPDDWPWRDWHSESTRGVPRIWLRSESTIEVLMRHNDNGYKEVHVPTPFTATHGSEGPWSNWPCQRIDGAAIGIGSAAAAAAAAAAVPADDANSVRPCAASTSEDSQLPTAEVASTRAAECILMLDKIDTYLAQNREVAAWFGLLCEDETESKCASVFHRLRWPLLAHFVDSAVVIPAAQKGPPRTLRPRGTIIDVYDSSSDDGTPPVASPAPTALDAPMGSPPPPPAGAPSVHTRPPPPPAGAPCDAVRRRIAGKDDGVASDDGMEPVALEAPMGPPVPAAAYQCDGAYDRPHGGPLTVIRRATGCEVVVVTVDAGKDEWHPSTTVSSSMDGRTWCWWRSMDTKGVGRIWLRRSEQPVDILMWHKDDGWKVAQVPARTPSTATGSAKPEAVEVASPRVQVKTPVDNLDSLMGLWNQEPEVVSPTQRMAQEARQEALQQAMTKRQEVLQEARSKRQEVLQELAHSVLLASQRARELQLPIDFDNALDDITFDDYSRDISTTGQDVERRMQSVASRRDVGGFYVGITSDPIWRWRGGASERGVMQGHCRTYQQMVILAFRAPGLAAPLEKMLIECAMASYSDQCLNKAKGNRGCVKGVAGFVYIVFHER